MSEQPRAEIERDLGANVKRGALFFREDGVTYFQFTVDASSVIGPRRATKQDQRDHPDAWAQLAEATDGDGDGEQGGSLPGPAEPKKRGRPPKVKADDGSTVDLDPRRD